MKKILLVVMLAGFAVAVSAQTKSDNVSSSTTKEVKVTKTVDAKTSDVVKKTECSSTVSKGDKEKKIKKEVVKEDCDSEASAGCGGCDDQTTKEKKLDKPKK